MKNQTKEILYIDMDGVCADFLAAIRRLEPNKQIVPGENSDWIYDVCVQNPMIFHDLEPIKGSIEAIKTLAEHYDIFFLSVPMWCVPDSFTGKRVWIEKHFGDLFKDRLILTTRKDLAIGHFLIDDRLKHGVSEFIGHHIHFDTELYPDWASVLNFLLPKE